MIDSVMVDSLWAAIEGIQQNPVIAKSWVVIALIVILGVFVFRSGLRIDSLADKIRELEQ